MARTSYHTILFNIVRGVAQFAELQALEADAQCPDFSGCAGIVPQRILELQLQLQSGMPSVCPCLCLVSPLPTLAGWHTSASTGIVELVRCDHSGRYFVILCQLGIV